MGRSFCFSILAYLLAACDGVHESTASRPSQTTPASAENLKIIDQADPDAAKITPLPRRESNPLKNAYFGELHLHTAYSLDAFIGGMALMPEDAMRFAKGESIEINGKVWKIQRPLDFFAISDHAEFIGEMYTVFNENAPGHDSKEVKQILTLKSVEEREKWFLEYVVGPNRTKPQHASFYGGANTTINAWKDILDTVERHNNPGTFTTIPAFEWSAAPDGANLHRNVFFRDSNVPDKPSSYIELNTEEQLWQWMRQLRTKGMKVFAVPHNSNASKGRMFPSTDSSGRPVDESYAQTRNTMEPAIEMMQVKGNSEVHVRFWPNDEFANFENADSIQHFSERTFRKSDFVREGLKKGLEVSRDIGVNPFQYGVVGGTDNHNGRPADNWESSYPGSHGAADDTVKARRDSEIAGWIQAIDANPGSLTGVWAPENTRAAIWDAIYQRETFATSGTRIQVRLFGGFGLPTTTESYEEIVKNGYAKGVPMGGTLKRPTGSMAPTFYIYAIKDPDGANLDRVQIIKAWVNELGETQEFVFDALVSPGREIDKNGKALDQVGNSVDAEKARYSNSIGAVSLSGVWRDPQFNPEHRAFYYLRAIEIPTPRWSTYDAVRAGLPLPEGVPATIQERAWSSPIWYEPGIGRQSHN